MEDETKKLYVKAEHIGIIAQHSEPTFKYRFDEEPIIVREDHANFLVKDNPSMFSIVKGHKPKTIKKTIGINLEEADKDELLDYTAKKGIKADYTMTVEQLKNKIKEVSQ